MKSAAAFSPGFRMSRLDVAFVLLALACAPLLGRVVEQLAIAELFAVLHFFLFCNVLRANRSLELLWAAVFVCLWSTSYFSGVPSWPYSYGMAFTVTVAVTIVQLSLPSYHGAFWRVLNPGLPRWWEQQTGSKP